MSVDIVLNKANRRYSPGDKVVGTVVFVCKGKTAHKGINLVMEGILLMEVATGVKKAFTFPKPTTLAALTLELAKPGGHLNDGKTEIPFEFTMEPLPGQQLHESFHGECINVRYTITCTCIRGFAKANLVKEIEFLTEVKVHLRDVSTHRHTQHTHNTHTHNTQTHNTHNTPHTTHNQHTDCGRLSRSQ
eukprot:TRINITY_DN1773_c0_g1_i2.p2 TRINITY_DN1773_c0_g1~~TRINITY_DN1773_c0_g1_i2.p2  ORF type:complete len:189 (-),score=42.09 TRINITY_DN1773_c0_g1_i2:443-1009(-)